MASHLRQSLYCQSGVGDPMTDFPLALCLFLAVLAALVGTR